MVPSLLSLKLLIVFDRGTPPLSLFTAEGLSIFISRSLKIGALYEMDSTSVKVIHHLQFEMKHFSSYQMIFNAY